MCRGGRYSFPWIAPLYLWSLPYNILSAKQGSIKYHFFSLWYDSTWDWTSVTRTIGEHSNHYANAWHIMPMSCCAFHFLTTDILGCYRDVMTLFEQIKHKFLNKTTLHVPLCGFQISWNEEMHIFSVHQLPWYYPLLRVPTTAWTATAESYKRRKLTRTDVLQIFLTAEKNTLRDQSKFYFDFRVNGAFVSPKYR